MTQIEYILLRSTEVALTVETELRAAVYWTCVGYGNYQLALKEETE